MRKGNCRAQEGSIQLYTNYLLSTIQKNIQRINNRAEAAMRV